MKHMITVQVPATEKGKVDFVTCDLCGKKIDVRGFDDQSGPGWGHTCKVAEGGTTARPLNSTDCPALPYELYPDV